MSNTRIITCALAVAGTLFIGSQARAQGGPAGGVNTNILNTQALAAAIAQALRVGTPVAFLLGRDVATFSVPLGQRLVIEYISGLCDAVAFPSPNAIPTYDRPRFQVTTNGVTLSHFIARPVNPVLTSNQFNTELVMGHLVKIYADPGTVVSLIADNCSLFFSGQLVTP